MAAGSTAEDPLCPDEDDADALSDNQTVQRHVEAKPPLQRQYALDVLVLYELLAEANAMAVQAGAPITRRDLDPCLLYTSPSPRDATLSRMPSSA